jgi:hypothetical protein
MLDPVASIDIKEMFGVELREYLTDAVDIADQGPTEVDRLGERPTARFFRRGQLPEPLPQYVVDERLQADPAILAESRELRRDVRIDCQRARAA